MFAFRLEVVCEAVHEANRVLQRAVGDPVSPPWQEATPDDRSSTASGVLAVLENELMAAADLHQVWVEFKTDAGWRWGPTKDDTVKEHPYLVPYHELPLEQQAKDRLFIAIVRALARTHG